MEDGSVFGVCNTRDAKQIVKDLNSNYESKEVKSLIQQADSIKRKIAELEKSKVKFNRDLVQRDENTSLVMMEITLLEKAANLTVKEKISELHRDLSEIQKSMRQESGKNHFYCMKVTKLVPKEPK